MTRHVSLITTLVLRGTGALFSVLAVYFVLKTSEANDAAEYFVVLNAVIFLSMLCSLGMSTFLTRTISISRYKEEAVAYCRGVFYRVLFFVLALGFIYNTASRDIANFFDKPFISDFNVYVTLSVFIWSFLNVYVGALIGFSRANLASLAQNIAPYLFVIGGCLASYLVGIKTSTELALGLLILGLSAGLILCVALIRRYINKMQSGSGKKSNFAGVSFYTFSHWTQYALFSGVTFINMKFISSLDVAAVYSMQRVIGVLTLLLIVINMVASPKFASLWSKGDTVQLKSSVIFYSRLSFVFCLPLFLLFFTNPDKVLVFFSPDFLPYVEEFRILLVGVFFSVICGPVTVILQMLGFTKVIAKVNFLLLIPILLSSSFLSKSYGVLGLCCSISLLFLVQNLLLLIVIKRKLGYFPILGR